MKGGINGSLLCVAGASSGDFASSRPGHLVWRYVKPYEQQPSADSQMLCTFNKDLNQTTERKLDTPLDSGPVAILLGSSDLAKNFTLKEGDTKDGIDWVELTPKAKDIQFQRITIGFCSGELQGMELRGVFGNITLLTLSNIQRNPQLPANVFRFTPSKGVDVIKQ